MSTKLPLSVCVLKAKEQKHILPSFLQLSLKAFGAELLFPSSSSPPACEE